MRGSCIVDATLISAPSSTKNAEKKRDPEKHQAKKGNQWYFSMKCHTGVDAGNGFVHTVEATAANVHDVTIAAKLLREDDEVVYGDSAYLGLEKRDEIKHDPGFPQSNSALTADRASCPGSRTMPLPRSGTLRIENHLCATVEHLYRIAKNIFGFRKTVYRELRKNLN